MSDENETETEQETQNRWHGYIPGAFGVFLLLLLLSYCKNLGGGY